MREVTHALNAFEFFRTQPILEQIFLGCLAPSLVNGSQYVSSLLHLDRPRSKSVQCGFVVASRFISHEYVRGKAAAASANISEY
jgi:hypothetical protein